MYLRRREWACREKEIGSANEQSPACQALGGAVLHALAIVIRFACSSDMLENFNSIARDSSVTSSTSAPRGVSAMDKLELAANALNSLTTLRGGEEGGLALEGMPETDGRGGTTG